MIGYSAYVHFFDDKLFDQNFDIQLQHALEKISLKVQPIINQYYCSSTKNEAMDKRWQASKKLTEVKNIVLLYPIYSNTRVLLYILNSSIIGLLFLLVEKVEQVILFK